MSDELFATIESLEGECAAYREDIQKLTKQRDDLREALASLAMAVRGLQVDSPDGGNPYYAPSPEQGRALLSIYEQAMQTLANLNKTDGE